MKIYKVVLAPVFTIIVAHCVAQTKQTNLQQYVDKSSEYMYETSLSDTMKFLSNANIPVLDSRIEEKIIKVEISQPKALCSIFYILYESINDLQFNNSSDSKIFNQLVLEQKNNLLEVITISNSSISDNPILYRNIINKCFYIEQELVNRDINYNENPIYKTTFLLRRIMQMLVAYECVRVFSENNRSEIAQYIAGGMSFYGDIGATIPVDVSGTIAIGGDIKVERGLKRSNVGTSQFTKASVSGIGKAANTLIGGVKGVGTIEGKKSKKLIGLASSTMSDGIAYHGKRVLQKGLSAEFMKYRKLISIYQECIKDKAAYISELQSIFNKNLKYGANIKFEETASAHHEKLNSHVIQQLLITIVNEFMYKDKNSFNLHLINPTNEMNSDILNEFKQLDIKVYSDAEKHIVDLLQTSNASKKTNDLINGHISLLLSNTKNIIELYFQDLLLDDKSILENNKKLKKIINGKRMNYSILSIDKIEDDIQKLETYANAAHKAIKDAYNDFKSIDTKSGITNYYSSLMDVYCFLLMLSELKQIPDAFLQKYNSLLNLLKITLDTQNFNKVIKEVENLISTNSIVNTK